MHGANSDGRSGGWRWRIAALVWLVYLLYPIMAFVQRPEPLLRDIGAAVMLVTFVAVYAWAWGRPPNQAARLMAGAAALTALSIAALWWLHLPSALGGLVFAGPLLGFIPSWRLQIPGALAVISIMVAAWLLGHYSASLLWSLGLPFLGLVVVMRIYGEYWHLFYRLHEAEASVRELAVANERLKLARDLHDIVGHNLSVVALRADLAAQQADGGAPEAAAEMRQVAQTAREALHDVREVISRWRGVAFADEWAHAERVLASAGVQSSITLGVTDLQLPPELNRVLGFFVREGVTNILRHSRATECRLTVTPGEDSLCMRLEDNGMGAMPATEDAGSGITGLRERLGEIGGRLAAFPRGTGYVLEATVPWSGGKGAPGAAH